jgi:molybdenum cofactor cytidylyltransferase
VRPARGNEHGHPVIFDRSLFDELRSADPALGAKSVVRAHAAEILNLRIDDPGAFLDIDTPEVYARVVKGL